MLTGTMIAGMLTGCGSDSSGKSSSSVISGSSETETETTEADESDDKTPVTFEYFNADGKNGNWDNPDIHHLQSSTQHPLLHLLAMQPDS